jgi:hypothetical protein
MEQAGIEVPSSQDPGSATVGVGGAGKRGSGQKGWPCPLWARPFFVFAGRGKDSSSGSFCPIRTEPVENRTFYQTAGKHNMLHVFRLLVAICCDNFETFTEISVKSLIRD